MELGPTSPGPKADFSVGYKKKSITFLATTLALSTLPLRKTSRMCHTGIFQRAATTGQGQTVLNTRDRQQKSVILWSPGFGEVVFLITIIKKPL